MRDNIFNNPCLLWNRNHNKWGFLHEEYVVDPAGTIYILQKKGLENGTDIIQRHHQEQRE